MYLIKTDENDRVLVLVRQPEVIEDTTGYIEVEVTPPNDDITQYLYQNGSFVKDEVVDIYKLTTPEEEAKVYLASTDWVSAKLSDYQLMGKELASELDKYESILDKREACRALLSDKPKMDI